MIQQAMEFCNMLAPTKAETTAEPKPGKRGPKKKDKEEEEEFDLDEDKEASDDEEEEEDEESDGEEEEEESDAPSLEDVLRAFQKFTKDKANKPKAIKLLKAFGVTSVREIPKEKYQKALDKLESLS